MPFSRKLSWGTVLVATLGLATATVGCDDSKKDAEPRGSTSSKSLSPGCSIAGTLSEACFEENVDEMRDEQRQEWKEDEERENEERRRERERRSGIELDEEDEPCRPDDPWCIG